MTTSATLPFKTSRVLGRIGMVIIFQVLAIVLGVTAAAAAMTVVDFSKSVGGFLVVLGFLVVAELILIIRVSGHARRAYRSGQRDVALGWLIGLLAVVGIPFLLLVLVIARAFLPL